MIIRENRTESTFKLPPSGSHLGRLYRILDLGTQKVEWQGAIKMQRKLMFSFELHGEDNDGQALTTNDGKPLMISKRYTMSLGEQSTLRKDLESWRGKKFTAEELMGFDLNVLLGKFAMCNVTHNDREGKTYANLSGLSQVPAALKKMPEPTGVNELLIFSLDAFDQAKFDSLSDGLKDIIKKSAEWRGTNGEEEENKAVAMATLDDDTMPF
jgi:hypothetical protein